MSDQSIVVWGRYNEGQLILPFPDAGFVNVAAAVHHSLGIKADGSIVAWGSNSQGQSTVPPPNTGFVAAAAGDAHTPDEGGTG